jgi:dihydroorotate dehydrogenase
MAFCILPSPIGLSRPSSYPSWEEVIACYRAAPPTGGPALPVAEPRPAERKMAGVSGAAIRYHTVEVVRRLRMLADDKRKELVVIGVGGVSAAEHVTDLLNAGATCVQLCTAGLFNPFVAIYIRRNLGAPGEAWERRME